MFILSVKTLSNWIVAANEGTLSKIGKTEQRVQTDLEAELARVKCELATMTMERDILKNRRSISRRSLAVKYDRIDVMRQDYLIALLCQVFEVDVSSYYAWRRTPELSSKAMYVI